MKRIGTVGLLLLGLGLLVSCGNFSFQNPIGAPTVVMERPDAVPNTDENELEVQFQFHTLPGSPGGVVLKLDFDDPIPDYAPLIDVPACPFDAKVEDCKRVPWKLTISPIPSAGSMVVRTIRVQGYNGAVMDIRLPSPVVVY